MLSKTSKAVFLAFSLFSSIVYSSDGSSANLKRDKFKYSDEPPKVEQSSQINVQSDEVIRSGYNHPAEINLDAAYDVFITAAATYWDIQQEGMKVGSTYTSAVSSGPGGFADTLYINDQFKPGFEVGLGVNTRFDDWVLKANYIWLHHTLQKNQGSFPFLSTPFVLVGSGGGGVVFTNSSHKWSFGIDIGDLLLSRPCYQGERLTINPYFGLRTQFFSQSYHISGTTTLTTNATSIWKSSSWAIGPRFGLESNWLLGAGFKLIAGASGSLLFTKYAPLKYQEPTATSISSTGYSFKMTTQDYLRADLDSKIGVAWGQYSAENRFHFEFAATYDFQVFFSQNMITWMMNNINNVEATAGNLYLNGLTVEGRFDF